MPDATSDCGADPGSGRSPRTDRAVIWLLAATAIVGAATLGFHPTFAFPHGDEATYISYAQNPWTNISPFFEGFRPKEVQNPYNFRLLLAPISLLSAVLGPSPHAARLPQLAWGLLLLHFGLRLGKSMGASRTAVAVMAVLASSPYFLFFTRAVRPEGMFVMWMTLTTWALVRRADPTPRTWASVAFLASCHLWIHYNGVVMPVVFFLALLQYDRRDLTRRKFAAFLVGGAAFLALYLPLNILPALETIREFGVMPVTFASTNRIPMLHAANPGEHLRDVVSFYRGYFEPGAAWWIDPSATGPVTLLLLPFALAATCFPGARRERAVMSILLLVAAAMIFVFPNRRPEYAWYLVPSVFVLAGRGLSRLPAAVRRALTAVVLGIVVVVFLDAAARDLWKFAHFAPANARTALSLRRAVAECGAATPRVMGGQEFSAAVPGVEFRTFHSLQVAGSATAMIDRLRPDVVIQHTRGAVMMAILLERGSAGGPTIDSILAANQELMKALRQTGFRRWNDASLTWDDQDVILWIKDR